MLKGISLWTRRFRVFFCLFLFSFGVLVVATVFGGGAGAFKCMCKDCASGVCNSLVTRVLPETVDMTCHIIYETLHIILEISDINFKL